MPDSDPPNYLSGHNYAIFYRRHVYVIRSSTAHKVLNSPSGSSVDGLETLILEGVASSIPRSCDPKARVLTTIAVCKTARGRVGRRWPPRPDQGVEVRV